MSLKDRNNTVLIAIDGSDNSEYAARFYADYIHKTGVQVHLVCAMEISASVCNTNPTELEQMLAEGKANAEAVIDKFKSILKPIGVLPSHAIPAGGDPWQNICTEAEKQKVYMIVIGSRGLSKVQQTLLGSVSDSVIHHANVPVLVCKMPEL